MTKSKVRGLSWALGILALTAVGVYRADAGQMVNPGDLIVRIEAAQGVQTGVFERLFTAQQTIDGTYVWQLPLNEIGTQIKADGTNNVLATVDGITLTMITDPAVSLGFAVTAGAADTTFTITSALVAFPALANPEAYAQAGVTITDNDEDGVAITGLFAGGKIYEARYNGSMAWADLVSSFNAPAEGGDTQSERKPPVSGRLVIADNVSSIQGQFKFTLSADDQASATSRFDVLVPEPATLGLLVMAGGLFLRRTRR